MSKERLDRRRLDERLDEYMEENWSGIITKIIISLRLTDGVKSLLKEAKMDLTVMPGGLTSLLQPLDVNKCK